MTTSISRLARHPLVLGLATAGLLALPAVASADAVTDWNALAAGIAPQFGPPQHQSRVLSIVHVAVHDALNTIDARYRTYSSLPKASRHADTEAAIAAASRTTLLGLLAPLPDSPNKANAIAAVNAAYDAAVGPAPLDANTLSGIAAGEAAAFAILQRRQDDGSGAATIPYTRSPGIGVYKPTPNPEFPAVVTPSFEHWADVTPFALRHPAQIPVLPSLAMITQTAAYARDYNEVKSVGNALVRGAAPDSEQSDVARFWPGGGANWNLSARLIVAGRGLDEWQHARLFALLNMAEADGHISNQFWKYTYTFWRPVTAIRWSNDGNPATSPDPAWRPFLVTPAYPDYPCALPTATATSTEVLRDVLGTDSIAFTRSFNAPPVALPAPLAALPGKTITRSFSSLSQAERESIDARVFAGIHFRAGCEAGVRHGTWIARYVIGQELRPIRKR